MTRLGPSPAGSLTRERHSAESAVPRESRRPGERAAGCDMRRAFSSVSQLRATDARPTFRRCREVFLTASLQPHAGRGGRIRRGRSRPAAGVPNRRGHMPPTSESPPPLQIYIGSSSNAELVAGAVRDVLSRLAREHYPELAGAQFGLWTNAQAIGSAAFGAVSDAAAAAQFGVFVLAADDRVDDGDATATAPSRDVVYELGVFTGQLGIDRVFVVSPERPTGARSCTCRQECGIRARQNARSVDSPRQCSRSLCHAILEAMNSVLQAQPARTDSERDQTHTAQSESPAESVLMAELLVDLRRGNLPALRTQATISTGAVGPPALRARHYHLRRPPAGGR